MPPEQEVTPANWAALIEARLGPTVDRERGAPGQLTLVTPAREIVIAVLEAERRVVASDVDWTLSPSLADWAAERIFDAVVASARALAGEARLGDAGLLERLHGLLRRGDAALRRVLADKRLE